MPEITDAELRTFARYQNLGTPEDLQKKITDLERDNHKYRQEEKPALEAKLPKEGEVVIPKEKADALASYEALGKPEELKTVAQEVEELRTKDQQRTREDAFRAAARAVGWPEDTVLTLLDMRSLDGAAVELKPEKNDRGEDVQVPYVTLAGEGQKAQKLSDFAANSPQLKGLRTEPVKGEERPATRTFARQASDGASAEAGGPVEARIQRNQQKAAARPNPLLPK